MVASALEITISTGLLYWIVAIHLLPRHSLPNHSALGFSEGGRDAAYEPPDIATTEACQGSKSIKLYQHTVSWGAQEHTEPQGLQADITAAYAAKS